MTSEQLAAIRERAEQATPGPWIVQRPGREVWQTEPYAPGPALVLRDEHIYEPNAVFIAHAREDIPALLDRIAWWEGQFKRVQDGLTAHSNKLWNIRKLHRPIKGLNTPNCVECNRNTTTADILADYGTPWPCPTIQAIEGDRT